MTEVDEKAERLARLAHARGLRAVLLSRQPNFAWLSGGQSNRIDGSVEIGEGSLCVTANGERFLVANAIEMPRLRDEALSGLGFAPLAYDWTLDHHDSAAPLNVVRRAVGRGQIGWDLTAAAGDTVDINLDVRKLHTPLTDTELDRYRRLGQDVARALEGLCRTLKPGESEKTVAARASSSVGEIGARAVVALVGGDERISQFRHPVPTRNVWHHTLMIGLCAEREGLVVALSRIITTRPTVDMRTRTAAAKTVFAALLASTRPGVTGQALFATAAEAYRNAGFPDEETKHHQGGAIGYRSRDWIAHPTCNEVVRARQAFAWNPSITGTKVEDTALILDEGIEPITSTGDWPGLEIEVDGQQVRVPGLLEI